MPRLPVSLHFALGIAAVAVSACEDPKPEPVEDLDNDGFTADQGDCVDTDSSIYPGAPEVPYDGVDQDCDGSDLMDGDGDGVAGASAGGADCDDEDAGVFPNAPEVPYDGIDQDCDGEDLIDVDGDGFDAQEAGGTDCDDDDAAISPTGTEVPYDGVDQNCDGEDLLDADGDGFDALAHGGPDCNDLDDDIHPAAFDFVGDGMDANCDGVDGVDADGDGFLSESGGGDDCDDAVATTHPGADDPVGDGVDADCDEADGADRDGDGHHSLASGGDDCNDASSVINPSATDIVGDLIDQNCDGLDGTDMDRDGVASRASGGDDCDDADPAAYPGAADAVGDGVDQSCDGIDGTDDDGDGHAALAAGGGDCDDADPLSLTTDDDGDCDGVVTAADCDDADPLTLSIAEEATVSTTAGMRFVSVCAHSFDMGCTPGQGACSYDEYPVMPVTLSHSFEIGEAEVTRGAYAALMGTSPSAWYTCMSPSASTCPLDRVTWSEAAAFANALSTAAGLPRCYTCTGSSYNTSCTPLSSPYACTGYRLPTEAEWEAAARCGEDTLYAGSNTATDVADFPLVATGVYAAGHKAPNTCGIYDMSGSVWEYVWDYYNAGYYTSSGRVDPVVSTAVSGGLVVRGYSPGSTAARVSARIGNFTDGSQSIVGFRLARTLP